MKLPIKISYRALGTIIAGIIAGRKGKKQEAEGRQKIAQSEQLIPEEVDGEQRLALNRIQRKTDSYNSGSFASSMYDELNQNYANVTEGALSLASGGGSDVTALLRQGKTAGQAFNQVLGAVENKGMAYENEAQRQLEAITQRRLELQLLKHQEKRYDGQTMLQAGLQNQAAGNATIAAGVEDAVSTVLGIFKMGSGKSKGGSTTGALTQGNQSMVQGEQQAVGGNSQRASVNTDGGGADGKSNMQEEEQTGMGGILSMFGGMSSGGGSMGGM